MENNPFPLWLIPLFPLVFAAFWIFVTQLLAKMSGWSALQDRYPDRPDEPAQLTLRFQTASIGAKRVNYKNCLTLSATSTGLRVSVWRLFGLFQSPFLVPWEQIQAEPVRVLLLKGMLLRFGNPEVGQMIVSAGTWERLVEASRGADGRLRRRA